MPIPFFIVGPTSVGKTALAAEVARRCNGEIVSADAFQVYRGLDILTAKPGRGLRAEIPHHLVDVTPVSLNFDAGQFLVAARRAMDDIAARGKLPIVAGGTGLYIRALTHGLAGLPKADSVLRSELERMELNELQQRIARLDPATGGLIDLKNKRRLVRAIEVCILTGRPFSEFRREWQTPAKAAGIFLTRDRDDLHKRIDERVEEMFETGVVEEIGSLEAPSQTARQAIGWKEVKAYLDGQIDLALCMEEIKRATRKYAKRQLTWFRRQANFEAINLSFYHLDFESAVELIVRRAASSLAPADV